MKVNTHVLVLCIVLAPLLALSQSAKKGNGSIRKEQKVQVKIMKDEDGQSTLIDTSFSSLEEAKAAMKKIAGKKMLPQEEDEDRSITLNFDCETNRNETSAKARPFKKKNKIMIFRDDLINDESMQALKELEAFRIEILELSELSEIPEIKMFNHEWAMNNGRGFSLSVSEPSKDELSKASLKSGNTEDLIEDLNISGSNSKNKIKVSFEVIEPTSLTIKVLSENGKEIYTQSHTRYVGAFNNQIDFGRRIKGSYFLIVTVNGKNLIRKINRAESTSIE